MRRPPPTAPIDLRLVSLQPGAGIEGRRAALLRVLGERLGLPPAELRFRRGEWGKPELVGSEAAFNFSHSGGLALIAIAERGAVGVDVERVRPRRHLDRLVQRVLTDAERAWLECAPDERERLRRFYRCWTAKEAVAKAFGCGLALAPRRLEVTPGEDERGTVRAAPAESGPLPGGAGPVEVGWTRPAPEFVAAHAIL